MTSDYQERKFGHRETTRYMHTQRQNCEHSEKKAIASQFRSLKRKQIFLHIDLDV
jgi:hypothetical protein